MSCSSEFVQLLHKYMDHEVTSEEEKKIKEHLQTCKECYQHFHELEKTVALVKSTSHIEAPIDFTKAVMDKLPKEKRTVSWKRWFKGHPLLAAASMFVLLMTGSLFSAWNEDQDFSVSKQSNLVVENSKVTVPKGEVVKGDVTVKNGELIIEGTIQGDVTVINGDNYLAQAGQVTGEIEEVDELFEWLWYHIKSISEDVVGVFS
ncbi:anti-sigma factor family protein [Metabacillus sediminilitoris]|uniref:Anti-sigma-W factor RsiW n=1 Tax=Metabacillus sediminilitoris TaxID=2567941 RepID=A0A4S4BNC3_9BACI|nr:anti-sigma factor [Metabacillus sediminilitoris]QGQ44038.1 anti-sigma factor [Metabacillus sediminilitoris]THF75448.1 anti-sigma factor [Metabacillus sediminilitoris]